MSKVQAPRWALLLLPVILASPAFADPGGNGHGNDPGDQGEDDDDDEDDGGGGVSVGPCAGGGWGDIAAPERALHVRTTGDDATGDGSVLRPYLTVGRALDAARAAPGPDVIAVGPGQFSVSARLDTAADVGTAIAGCSPAETTLTASDAARPIADFAVANTALAGVTLSGGTDALTVRDGALAIVRDVVVSRSSGTGAKMTGATTTVNVDALSILDTQLGGACGWGAHIDGATVDWRGGAVERAIGVGVFANAADLDLRDASVLDTAPNAAGALGRGVHTQDTDTTLRSLYLSGNTDAGVFLLRPHKGTVQGIVIDFTGAGFVGGTATGDGIVVLGGARTVSLADNDIWSSARAAILLDDTDAGVSGNRGGQSGALAAYGADALAQGAVALGGPDAKGFMVLGAGSLALDSSTLSCP